MCQIMWDTGLIGSQLPSCKDPFLTTAGCEACRGMQGRSVCAGLCISHSVHVQSIAVAVLSINHASLPLTPHQHPITTYCEWTAGQCPDAYPVLSMHTQAGPDLAGRMSRANKRESSTMLMPHRKAQNGLGRPCGRRPLAGPSCFITATARSMPAPCSCWALLSLLLFTRPLKHVPWSLGKPWWISSLLWFWNTAETKSIIEQSNRKSNTESNSNTRCLTMFSSSWWSDDLTLPQQSWSSGLCKRRFIFLQACKCGHLQVNPSESEEKEKEKNTKTRRNETTRCSSILAKNVLDV